MKRLIVGSLVSVPLMLVAACSGDPTESLRNGIVQLTASPSQVFVQQGRTAKVRVSAIDEQGNQIVTSFDASNVGSGITVERDLTFQPLFVNDSTLAPPEEAAVFQFDVDAVDLVNTTFTLNAGGKSVDVPVTVTPDPASLPAATVTTNGATAADPITVSIAAPLIFTSASTVATDAGAGIVTGVAADGSSITFFAPPGTTVTASICGVALTYLTTANECVNTDVPLSISSVVPGQAGTDNPATAPVLALPASGGTLAFYDGAPMAATQCGPVSGFPCQLYRIDPTADIAIDASLAWSNAADLGLYVMDASFTDTGQFCDANGRGDGNQPEACTLALTAGTYYLIVVSFGPGYPENDPNPDWIALSLTTE